MLKIDWEACASCISTRGKITSRVRVSHYNLTFSRGKYYWNVVLTCNGQYGIPEIRTCELTADDDEQLYRELYGSLPDGKDSFSREIRKERIKILKRHCEMSKRCPFYEMHLLK